MVKLQEDSSNNRYHITIPKSKVQALGWDEKEEVKLDVSTLPDRDGVSAREI